MATSTTKQTLNDAIKQYEDLIIKNERITLKGSEKAKATLAQGILRYALAELLGWSGQDAKDHLTPQILDQMKLYTVLNYIKFPPDIDKRQDMEYIAFLAFPENGFDYTQQTLKNYHRVLDGELSSFRKNFFKGKNGYKKLAILIREFIANNLAANSIPELYAIFSNSSEISRKLSKAKLLPTINRMCDTPLDCFHDSLTDMERDEFLYNVYTYLTAYRCYVSEIGYKKGLTNKTIKNAKPKRKKTTRTKTMKKKNKLKIE